MLVMLVRMPWHGIFNEYPQHIISCTTSLNLLKISNHSVSPALTLCLLVSSANNLCNSLDPDQFRLKVGSDLDPNCLTF